ncbi:MAG: glycosyltransferase family 2 protein, partial [Gemmatimonadaceae bacterium]
MTKISVVIPAKNEEETLPLILDDLLATAAALPAHEIEILVVDDRSTDRTADVCRERGVRVVKNTRASGKGMALRAGFEAAMGDVLVMMDADYSHRAEELPVFLEALKPGVGLVIGSRVVGGSEEYHHVRALGNVFLSATLGLCTRRYLSDALNGYKAFRRDVFTDFTYTSKAFEIEIEIIANTLRKGYRIVEVSSHERARAGGEMKSRVVRHGTRFLTRILWEGMRGVTPAPSSLPAAAPAAPALRDPAPRENDGDAPMALGLR